MLPVVRTARLGFAYKAEHAFDLDTEIVVVADVKSADQADGDTVEDTVVDKQVNLTPAATRGSSFSESVWNSSSAASRTCGRPVAHDALDPRAHRAQQARDLVTVMAHSLGVILRELIGVGSPMEWASMHGFLAACTALVGDLGVAGRVGSLRRRICRRLRSSAALAASALHHFAGSSFCNSPSQPQEMSKTALTSQLSTLSLAT